MIYAQKTTLYINSTATISTVEDSNGIFHTVAPNKQLKALKNAYFTRQRFEGITNWIKF